jgi:biopolymer transport protein ExbD
MSMSSPTSVAEQAEPALNATPLIDVLLVLLVMLIFTLPVMTHKVAITLPVGTDASARSEIVSLDIDFDGAVFWNGEAVASIPVLERRLKALMERNPAARVDVRPDRRSVYGPTAQVLAATQRAHVRNIVIEQVPDR